MAKPTKRAAIIEARELLDLGTSTTLEEIKKAYRAKAKRHHPDTAATDREIKIDMHRLTEAYQILLAYCTPTVSRLRIPKRTPRQMLKIGGWTVSATTRYGAKKRTNRLAVSPLKHLGNNKFQFS